MITPDAPGIVTKEVFDASYDKRVKADEIASNEWYKVLLKFSKPQISAYAFQMLVQTSKITDAEDGSKQFYIVDIANDGAEPREEDHCLLAANGILHVIDQVADQGYMLRSFEGIGSSDPNATAREKVPISA